MVSETIIVHKTGRRVTCKRCSHTWDYYGQKIRANCPICRTTVTFDFSPSYTVAAATSTNQNQNNNEAGAPPP